MSGKAQKRLRKFSLKSTGSAKVTKEVKRVYNSTPRPTRGRLAREMEAFNKA